MDDGQDMITIMNGSRALKGIHILLEDIPDSMKAILKLIKSISLHKSYLVPDFLNSTIPRLQGL